MRTIHSSDISTGVESDIPGEGTTVNTNGSQPYLGRYLAILPARKPPTRSIGGKEKEIIKTLIYPSPGEPEQESVGERTSRIVMSSNQARSGAQMRSKGLTGNGSSNGLHCSIAKRRHCPAVGDSPGSRGKYSSVTSPESHIVALLAGEPSVRYITAIR